MSGTVPRPINPEYINAVGSVVYNWASLERTLAHYVSCILRVDQFRARVILASLPNIRARVTLIKRLAETFADDSVLPEFRRLVKRITKLGHRRNQLAHSIVLFHKSPKHVLLVNDEADNELGFDFVGSQLFQMENVKGWAGAIQVLRGDLVNFAFVLDKHIHASPKIHRVQRSDPSPKSDPDQQEPTPKEQGDPPEPSRG